MEVVFQTDRSFRQMRTTFVVAFALVLPGCLSGTNTTSETAKLSPIEQMRNAVEQGNWPAAWDLSASVLIEGQGDSDTLALVALVAFKNDRHQEAADLLVESCRMDHFADIGRIQQAFTALVSVGRLFDGIDLLGEAVRQNPNDTSSRKLVFDLLVGTEQHTDAVAHGRELVRQREFDLELLLAIERPQKRTRESDSLIQITQRNPSDLRPLVGVAKKQLDRQSYEESIKTLRSILEVNPSFPLAQVMLGRALVLSGRFTGLSAWADGLNQEFPLNSDYWLTMGDWAIWLGNAGWATEAYAQAAKLDPDRVEPWRKLSSAISSQSIPASDSAAINRRSSMLNRLRQQRAEFAKSDQRSTDRIHDIVESLVELGRLWEAEAWCAIALTLPVDSRRSQIESLRADIVRRMTKQTPWQLAEGFPDWERLESGDATSLLTRLSGNAPPDQLSPDRLLSSSRVLPRLVDEAESRELVFFGRTADDLDQPGIRIHQTLGCGGGTIDFDRDGWPDLYLVAAGGHPPGDDSQSNALFRNHSGRFTKVPVDYSGDDRGFGQGVAVGDVNEDGFDDLLVMNYGPNRIWINNGDGTFTDRSARWLPPRSSWSTSGAIADIDGDGISDVIIVNYCAGLEPATEDCDGPDGKSMRACSPIYFPAAPDRFLKGTDSGGLVDVTESWNAEPEMLGRGLGIVAGALDQRDGIDVLIVNDMTSNQFWTPQDSERFCLADTASVMGLAGDGQSRPQGSMGISAADIDVDGKIDLFVTNFENEYNTLYLRQGDSRWRDATVESGLAEITMPMVGFGTEAIDFDNDGLHELVITNGHVDFFEVGKRKSQYLQPAQLFQRNRDGRFDSIGSRIDSPYFQQRHSGRGLWTIDADRNGKMDLVISHQTEPVALLINRTASENHWLSIELVATEGSRTPIGSIVTASVAGRRLVAMLSSGDGYQCSNERCIRFGFGDTTGSAEATVQWPNGDTQTIDHLALDTHWLIVQGAHPFALTLAEKRHE
jgi:tetratricopeptide (TPR) repeat protein